MMLSRIAKSGGCKTRISFVGSSAVGCLQEATTKLASLVVVSPSQPSLSSPSSQQLQLQQQRCFSSKNNNNNNNSKKKFRPRRFAGPNYRQRGPKPLKNPPKKAKGPKEPNDVTRRVPKIDMTNIKITDSSPDDEDEDNNENNELLDPFPSMVLQMMREGKLDKIDDDIETQLKLMDYYTSVPGSTEDLVGERRAFALGLTSKENRDTMLRDIEDAIDKIRIENLRLPKTDSISKDDLYNEEAGGLDNQIPSNQLAHGDWGEMLVRTDRVCKMWRGGRIESFRALVIGGNLKGCGGFGIGKSFEAEDAVETACRMAKRNIFFVDRYRNRTLSRDLVGRQNSCKVVLRSTNGGLRGNPLCCEILKLFGITDVTAKAHGRRSHQNVVRATFKALMTHESLEDISLKRGVRLVNLQKAKRLQV